MRSPCCELDHERFERRKLEFYSDGRVGGACQGWSIGETELGSVAVPALSEINQMPEFEGEVLSKADFEELWIRHARGAGS
ncbi:DUF6881 domain-containing protein [Pelomonas cellulosilytica]|uniref:DUF6881 domain-containing protein n=1 Tax=Pelomonas cellulosilytica TaxID=2906762 RepID=UPI003B027B50